MMRVGFITLLSLMMQSIVFCNKAVGFIRILKAIMLNIFLKQNILLNIDPLMYAI